MRLPTTLGCVYLNPATRKVMMPSVYYGWSHMVNKTEEKELDDELEYLVRKWILDVWPFKCCVPGGPSQEVCRQGGWEVFEGYHFGMRMCRGLRDAQTVVMYNARACGLALGVVTAFTHCIVHRAYHALPTQRMPTRYCSPDAQG